MKVYYEETYGNWYDIDAVTTEDAEEKIKHLIGCGKENAPEDCQGSIVCVPFGNEDPQYQVMDAKIATLDDHEKMFYLWHLLRYYYKRKLFAEKEKYMDDRTTFDQIDRLIRNVEELDTLLCYEIF